MRLKSVADYEALTGQDALTTAEKKLIAAVRDGSYCELYSGKPTRPAAATDKTRIRADLLRLLILGGTKDCGLHERGVTLIGGWIEGALDLAYCTARGATTLRFCRFPARPRLGQARFLLLSLDDSKLDQGLFAQGARIKGSLYLRRLTATGTVAVNSAQVGGQLACEGARLDGKDGMALNAQVVTVGQSLFLSTLTATGTVDVNAAQIGGQLACEGARLDGKDGMALNAQGVTVGQSLFLSTLTATGTVDVNAAQIGGQLACEGATLDGKDGDALNAQGVTVGDSLFLRTLTTTGTVDVAGAQIGGQLSCTGAALDGKGGEALNAQRLRVTESLFFRDLGAVKGRIDLTSAHVGDLVDDPAAWPTTADDLILDGFTYDRLAGSAPTTLAARKDWLRAGSHWQGEFRPQPYTQLARVLRQMGHAGEARKVLIEAAQVAAKTHEKQHRARRRFARAVRRLSQRPDQKAFQRVIDTGKALPAPLRVEAEATRDLFMRLHAPLPTPPGAPEPLDALTLDYARQDFRNRMRIRALSSRAAILWSRVKTGFLWLIVGHGHAPQRAIGAVIVSTILAACWYAHAWQAGAMVPNSDIILTSFNWWWSMQDQSISPTSDWTATGTAKHYETFYSLAYAFDVLVPLVDLGQQSNWSATTVTWTGWTTRVLTMGLEVWGWVVIALGAAAVTGLVQRNQPD